MTEDANHPPSPSPAAAGPLILVDDRQPVPVDIEQLQRLALVCLDGEGRHEGELSVSLVTDEEITQLHERFMGESGPTDVLSFGFDDADRRDPRAPPLLGDVVIAPATATRNAEANGSDPDDELRLLLAHGILHLLGYDHEQDAGRADMWARQERYSGVRTP